MERIKEYRRKAEMTQEQLADRIGVKRSVVSKYENGSIDPPISLMCAISDVLQVPVDVLLGRAEYKRKCVTNGDYIRSLSDGELSILLNGNIVCDLCIHGAGCQDPYNMSRCIAGVKEYLGQERKVDDVQEKEEKPGAGAGCSGADEEGRA